MRLRALLLLWSAWASSCAGLEETVRTERGAKLREFERPRIVEGGLSGVLSIEAPSASPLRLKLEAKAYDTCRTERVEEFAEDRIRELHGNGAGAAVSAGVAFTAASAVVFAASLFISKEPDRTRIDGAGNYGAPPVFSARAWSIGLLCIGLPTLAVGIVQMLRTGEQVETVKVEQVASQRDETCNLRSFDGPVTPRTEEGRALKPVETQAGVALFDPPAENVAFDGFSMFDRELLLDDTSRDLLRAFNGCNQLDRAVAAEPTVLATRALVSRVEAARACRQIRAEAVAPELQRLEGELLRRRAGGEPGAQADGSQRFNSFEQALAAHPPRVTLEEGSGELTKGTEQLLQQSVLLKGRLQAGVSPNIAVVAFTDRSFFVFSPPDAPWASQDLPAGTSVEVLGIWVGAQTVGQRTAPLIRALWLRPVN